MTQLPSSYKAADKVNDNSIDIRVGDTRCVHVRIGCGDKITYRASVRDDVCINDMYMWFQSGDLNTELFIGVCQMIKHDVRRYRRAKDLIARLRDIPNIDGFLVYLTTQVADMPQS